jgi:nicotinamide-nucleotide amidase
VTALPGVPREMRAMWEQTIEPRLLRQASPPGVSRLFTHGLGESDQEARMADLPLVGVEFCSLPGPWGVELQCRAGDGDPSSRQQRAEEAREAVAERLGQAVVRPLGATLLESLVAGLRARRWQIALGESCTAGLAASKLADLPGVSDVFAGGVVAYANEVKVRQLGVSRETLERHGAVSRETALEMARGARGLMAGEGVGLGVTGIAGPDGGAPDKPVGTVWIALSGPGGERAEKLQLVGTRDLIRERAAWRLLGLAWAHLQPT